MTTTTKNVYQCIAAVAADIAASGIAKDRRNDQQGYRFRGIDDVYNALAPLLAKHGLVIIPRCGDRQMTERQTAKGGTLFTSVVDVEYDLVSAHDGSTHTARTYGEAMDSADKSTNKAMSAAYKYLAMQVFCIPTEGDNDADATTHDVAPVQRAARHAVPAPMPAPMNAPNGNAPADDDSEELHWSPMIDAAVSSGGDVGAALLTMLPSIHAESRTPYQRHGALLRWSAAFVPAATIAQIDDAGRIVKAWDAGTPTRARLLGDLTAAHNTLSAAVHA